MIEIFLGLFAIILGVCALFAVAVVVHLMMETEIIPLLLFLAFWSFIAYHIGRAILATV